MTNAQKLKLIKAVFINIPVIKSSSGYPYSFFSLTDYTPPMRPEIVEYMADLIVDMGNFDKADIIVSEADRGGGPLTHAVAIRVNLPYTLANWYPQDIPGETKVEASVGFAGSGHVYLNGVKEGQKAVVVDDLLSTGGTVDAIIRALEKSKVEVAGAFFVAEKFGQNGRQKILKNRNMPVKSLVKFAICDKMTVEVED